MIPLRINLWSGPRNVSTAFMYAMAQRNDIRVFDEPLYAHYLLKSNADHPGRAEVLTTMENEGQKVIDNILFGNYAEKIIFFKQMAHHLIDLKENFLHKMINILLIRNPHDVLYSYSKVINQPTLSDIGIKRQYDLFKKFGESWLVIDSMLLLKNPSVILRKMCTRLGIDFQENMLSWEAGARPEDGCWAKYWYSNVHCSTGWQPYQKKEKKLPIHLFPLWKTSQPYYDYLLQFAIK